jgi:hypothetical protein
LLQNNRINTCIIMGCHRIRTNVIIGCQIVRINIIVCSESISIKLRIVRYYKGNMPPKV